MWLKRIWRLQTKVRSLLVEHRMKLRRNQRHLVLRVPGQPWREIMEDGPQGVGRLWKECSCGNQKERAGSRETGRIHREALTGEEGAAVSYLEIRGAGVKGREFGDTNLGKVSAILMRLEQGVCLEKRKIVISHREKLQFPASQKQRGFGKWNFSRMMA